MHGSVNTFTSFIPVIKVHSHDVLTWDAVVGSLQVGLEVLSARLSDRVHRGDKQRAIASSGAESVHVLGDVTVASESVGVVGCDTAAGSHATVQRAADDDHVTGIAARREPLVDAVLTCLK